MKGSKQPKLAALLLVLTLVTTCFVSGTFAKYVSEGEGKDAARVAKWGVKVEITGDGFKTTYGKDEVNANVDGPTVVSSTTEKVIAPRHVGHLRRHKHHRQARGRRRDSYDCGC